jgi:UDP-MurNAc hydroxylase
LHGWEWNLETGRCLTTRGHELRRAREEHKLPSERK